MVRIITRCLVFGLALLCVPAFAQIAPNTYGTQSETSKTISAYDFQPLSSTMTWGDYFQSRYVSNGNGCCFFAGVDLPNGAVITALQIDGCDDDPGAGELDVAIETCGAAAGSQCGGVVAFIYTAGNPGCQRFRTNISPPLVVDNTAGPFFIQVGNPGNLTGLVKFRAVQIFYKLQVSPPPNTATFGDVPTTHLFYQYIEALAAAGITAGCGGGNFCPDAALTRGQMAVFLSKALGLHWPN
jgi:hypothetical protein